MIEIRTARLDDADAMCDAHVAAWRDAYRGLFPDDYLDADEFDSSRRENWRAARWLDSTTTWTDAVVLDGRVVGFANVGPERVDDDAPPTGRGEVYSFYLHPSAWGTGSATALMATAEQHLRDVGFAETVLWVLRDNPRARAFYEKAGWTPTGRESMWAGPTMFGVAPPAPVAELQYGRSL